jgi:hypothetical protein
MATETTRKKILRLVGIHEVGGRCYGPGEAVPIDEHVANILIARGHGTEVQAPKEAPKADDKPKGGKQAPARKAAPAQAKVAPKKSDIPEGFPSREVLIAAGLDTIKKIIDAGRDGWKLTKNEADSVAAEIALMG